MTSLQLFLMCFGWLLATPVILLFGLRIVLRMMSWLQMLHVQCGRCRKCGCTDKNCTECVLATGEPCYWIDESHTLCSRCVDHLGISDLASASHEAHEGARR